MVVEGQRFDSTTLNVARRLEAKIKREIMEGLVGNLWGIWEREDASSGASGTWDSGPAGAT